MPKASDLKKGSVVELDGEVYVARQIDVRKPSARGASTLYKVQFFGVRDGKKLEQTLRSDDFVKDGDLTRRAVQFSYREGDMTIFMDTENYSQYTLGADALEEQSGYMTEDLEVTDTAPGIKGASAKARNKPATLSTGIEIQVPEYLEIGQRVKVNTTNAKFISRA